METSRGRLRGTVGPSLRLKHLTHRHTHRGTDLDISLFFDRMMKIAKK